MPLPPMVNGLAGAARFPAPARPPRVRLVSPVVFSTPAVGLSVKVWPARARELFNCSVPPVRVVTPRSEFEAPRTNGPG